MRRNEEMAGWKDKNAVQEANVRFPALQIAKTCCIMNSYIIPRRWARQGACVVGFFDDDEFEALLAEANQFKPQELNKGNVQAIFSRCLVTQDTPKDSIIQAKIVSGKLFIGDIVQLFDKNAIQANRRSIEYQYGQLNCVRTEAPALTAMDPDFPYSGEFRPLGSETGIKFILLGTVAGVIETFNMKKDTARFLKQVRPTLSPKDPAFPAWWEAHKSEWEA